MKRINKEQAITAVGMDAVESVRALPCDLTNRVTDGTEWQGYTEFAATLKTKDTDDDEVILVAYYFFPTDEVMAAYDLSSLSWGAPDNYAIV